jgi:hypothetical protein
MRSEMWDLSRSIYYTTIESTPTSTLQYAKSHPDTLHFYSDLQCVRPLGQQHHAKLAEPAVDSVDSEISLVGYCLEPFRGSVTVSKAAGEAREIGQLECVRLV